MLGQDQRHVLMRFFCILFYCRLSAGKKAPGFHHYPAAVVTAEGFRKFYLEHNLCQSRLDGRTGSSACAVIAIKVCTAVLDGSLPLFNVNGNPSECIPEFLQCMREGNLAYDSCPATVKCDLLGVFDAVSLPPLANVRVAKELGFRNAGDCSRVLESVAQGVTGNNLLCAGVVVQTPYSVAVVAMPGHQFAIFDSHAHGDKGALIACTAGNVHLDSVACLLSELVGHFLDSHCCLLELCLGVRFLVFLAVFLFFFIRVSLSNCQVMKWFGL